MADILRETGRVVDVSGPMAKIVVVRRSSCENCGACGIGAKPEISFTLKNDIGAKVGDRVIVEMHSKALLKVAFLVYTIPLAALIIGFILGQSLGTSGGLNPGQAELTGIGIGFLFLILAFFALKWFDRLHAFGTDIQPQLISILGGEDDSNSC